MEEPSRRASVPGAAATSIAPVTTAMGSAEPTNIKVFCRLRQQNQLEKREGAVQCSTVIDGKTLFLRNERCDVDEIRCTFDRVFDIHSTQQEVYEHAAKPMVQDFLQGYNCTIFAYGQTGSGKTHTILGPKDGVLGRPEEEGIISRVVREIFRAVAGASKDVKVDLTASFVEIYMEQIRDLLAPSGTTPPLGGLKIRENNARGVYIDEMIQVSCATESAMQDVVKSGTLNRAVSTTRMNKDSSRSHCILMIGATRKDLRSSTVTKSTMYIVDLAGSEFVNKTNASGKVLQEAKAINKSLSALSNVIKLLGEGKKHVPYRDSKLTRLLQDSLGGTAKTCLILAASCSSYNMPETISTLRFGLRAKEIKNPVAQKSDGGLGPGGIFKELYQQAMVDIEEKNKKIDELQRLLAQACTNAGTMQGGNSKSAPSSPLRSPAASPTRKAPKDQLIAVAPDNSNSDSDDDDSSSSTDRDSRDSDDLDVRNKCLDLEDTNRRLEDENQRLYHVLETLEHQLDQVVVSSWSGHHILHVGGRSDHGIALSLKVWLQSEVWRQPIGEADASRESDAATQPCDGLATPNSVAAPPMAPRDPPQCVKSTFYNPDDSTSPSSTPPLQLPSSSCPMNGDGSNCVHRADAEALSRQIVELKLQLHYLTESTRQSLDGEQYLIVLENAKLKTRIEELEFQANLSNVRCNQLEMKNRGCETRLSNQETHIACLQNSLHEYQGLFRQQIIMSQEKCRLLTDELEFYKKLSKTVQQSAFSHVEGSDEDGIEDAHNSPSTPQKLALVSPPSPLPSSGVLQQEPTTTPTSISPFRRWKSFGSFYKLQKDEDGTGASPPAPGTPLVVKAQRMIVKPMPNSPTPQHEHSAHDGRSPLRRRGFGLNFATSPSSLLARTASSPELLRGGLKLEDLLFDELSST